MQATTSKRYQRQSFKNVTTSRSQCQTPAQFGPAQATARRSPSSGSFGPKLALRIQQIVVSGSEIPEPCSMAEAPPGGMEVALLMLRTPALENTK
jgi:hypothetical protein